MRILTALETLATGIALLMAAPALAATPTTDGTTLTGATGVTIGGSTYNVEFLDGTCAIVFNGCDATSDFTFQTEANAIAASDALLAQVILGDFDTNPSLTRGCTTSSSNFCIIAVPYLFNGAIVNYAGANNSVSGKTTSTGSLATSIDLTGQSSLTFARFTLSTVPAVPEPATWAMMLLGFAGIGLAVRRRRTLALA